MKQLNRNATRIVCMCLLTMTPGIATRLAVPTMAQAVSNQTETVAGKVTDGSEPIIGASVMVKGTKGLVPSPTSTVTSN